MTPPIRSEYLRGSLSESDLDPDPIRQFDLWLAQTLAADVMEPYAMTLATATREGRPSARIVLLRAFDERGFMFHTCYESRKGRELEDNPFAALVLFWVTLERQVRIEGQVERVSEEESDAYFRGRPTGSQLGAWASRQSDVIPAREAFESVLAELREHYRDEPIPRPPNWGGYRLIPESLEFWQGRPSRLHDRLRYRRTLDNAWIIERLSP